MFSFIHYCFVSYSECPGYIFKNVNLSKISFRFISCFMPFFWSDPPFWWGPPLEVDRICTIPGHGLPSLQHQRGEQAGQSTVAVSQTFHQFRDHSLKIINKNVQIHFLRFSFCRELILQIPFSAATFNQRDISCRNIFCSDIFVATFVQRYCLQSHFSVTFLARTFLAVTFFAVTFFAATFLNRLFAVTF